VLGKRPKSSQVSTLPKAKSKPYEPIHKGT
jgi:hypothetical protein